MSRCLKRTAKALVVRSAGHPHSRQGDLSHLVANAMVSSRPTIVLLTLDAFASMAWVRHMCDLFESGTPLIIPLFSTATSFTDYMRACPEDLKRLGILKIMFQKWEASPHHPVEA